MNILLLNGSLRTGSVNEAMLNTVQTLASAHVQAEIYTGMAALPHFNPDDDHDPLPPAVLALRAAIASANALLICTPEYAGALPGAFKNLLDWTVGGIEMDQKPVCWINVSTSLMGAQDAHASLRKVLGYLNARIIEAACTDIPVPRQMIGSDGLIHDPATRKRIRSVLETVQNTIQRS